MLEVLGYSLTRDATLWNIVSNVNKNRMQLSFINQELIYNRTWKNIKGDKWDILHFHEIKKKQYEKGMSI